MSIRLPIYNLNNSATSSNLTSEISSLRGNIGIQEQSDTTSFDNLLGKSMTLFQ